MTRHGLTPILADIAATMDRVRELDIEGHARAAALQCLADARGHLERHVPGAVWGIAEYAAEGRARALSDYPNAKDIQRTIAHTSGRADLAPPFPSVALGSAGIWQGNLRPSEPPPATDNQRKRSEATVAFRNARRILQGILK